MAPKPKHPAWNKLRQYWHDLDTLRDQQARNWNSGQAQAERARREAAHRAVLDTLVAVGEIEPVAADQVQVAYAEMAFHIWRSSTPTTCYRTMHTYIAECDDLARQLDMLSHLSGDLDPTIVEQVRAAIAHDIAEFTSSTAGEAQDAAQALVDFVLGEPD